ncbi:MAG: UxaA family hydrolase [Thermomicrobia bacterium]|nr:UxaA family hydrolase [Thermomicrobia bacterium]
MGYRRAYSGRAGVRNCVLIIPSVVCSNTVVQRIAQQVPECVFVTHQHGCSQVGDDVEQTRATLIGYATNPNVAGVLVVSLGCETIEGDRVAQMIAETGQDVEFLGIQESGGIKATVALGIERCHDLLERASRITREAVPLSELILAVQCGGSDAFSGITANPALGITSDMLIAAGGTVMLAEVPECLGAEHLLAARARTPTVDLNKGNPAPGNIKGGLTTIEEKSIGAMKKGGSTPLNEVLAYAQPPTQRGLVIMDTPGNDIESVTGNLAGMAQMVVFTTGRGSVTGAAIAPVIKVATNTPMYEKMSDNMDLNAGTVVDGTETLQDVGRRIFEKIISVANGEQTRSEEWGCNEFGINRIGPSL